MKPQLLNATQYAGLLKIGDVLIPGDGELPSFSKSRCAEQADRMLAHMYDGDRNGVQVPALALPLPAAFRGARPVPAQRPPRVAARVPSPPPRA